MSTILVLLGGTSQERAVSLRSGAAVIRALETAGHTVRSADPADGIAVASDIESVFPVLHGIGGEDGSLQAILEASGVSFVGSDSVASRLCFDKWRYKQVLLDAGIDTPRGALVTAETCWTSPLISRPFVLKPFDGGSSVDTFIVRDPEAMDREAIANGLARNKRMLLEELIEGIEITVGVLDQTGLPVIEIIPPSDGEFDYENKYNGKTQELCPAQHLDQSAQVRAQELAVRIHTLTGCRDLSRTDMIVTPDGRMCVLETNTLPGFTDQSLFPKAAAAHGLTMVELTDHLVQNALQRRRRP